jgi:ribosomal-protein-alanine N-acetyltransferase
MVVAAPDQNLALLLDALWLPLRRALAACNTQQVGVLLLNPWLATHLPALGFKPTTEVITFSRSGPYLPPPLRADLILRTARSDDIEAVRAVDNEAFAPIWQYSTRDLNDASRHAAHFTLAEMNGRVVGYQLAAVHLDNAHLVRLAISPRLQGIGVGSMLLGETIEYFLKHKHPHMTVNTQTDNTPSQQLYHRFGFVKTDHRVPIWTTAV